MFSAAAATAYCVLEQGPWALALRRGLDSYLDDRPVEALAFYDMASTLGLTDGSVNAAWLLTQMAQEDAARSVDGSDALPALSAGQAFRQEVGRCSVMTGGSCSWRNCCAHSIRNWPHQTVLLPPSRLLMCVFRPHPSLARPLAG